MLNYAEESFWKGFWTEFEVETKGLEARNGFSYDLPKEEQIRAALYAYMRKLGEHVEVESDLKEKETDKVKGEADLRVLGDEAFLLVEIKRTWAVSFWAVNKYKEQLASWKKDIQKLEAMAVLQNKPANKCFFLVVFFDSDKLFEKVRLSEMANYVQEKWGDSAAMFKLDRFNFGNKSCRGYVWVER